MDSRNCVERWTNLKFFDCLLYFDFHRFEPFETVFQLFRTCLLSLWTVNCKLLNMEESSLPIIVSITCTRWTNSTDSLTVACSTSRPCALLVNSKIYSASQRGKRRSSSEELFFLLFNHALFRYNIPGMPMMTIIMMQSCEKMLDWWRDKQRFI